MGIVNKISAWLTLLCYFTNSFRSPVCNRFLSNSCYSHHHSLFAQQGVSYLHTDEYPGDDFSHILGFGDSTHKESKLQSISALRISDVKRSKTPIDTA